MAPRGALAIVQVDPFHNSIEEPTAAQNVGPVHDTLGRVGWPVIEALGLGAIDHADPFQLSISVFEAGSSGVVAADSRAPSRGCGTTPPLQGVLD